jgi:hypothetical protein
MGFEREGFRGLAGSTARTEAGLEYGDSGVYGLEGLPDVGLNSGRWVV